MNLQQLLERLDEIIDIADEYEADMVIDKINELESDLELTVSLAEPKGETR